MDEEVTIITSTIKIPEYDDKQVKVAVDNALENIKRIDQAFLETNGAIIIKELLHRVDKLQNNWNELKQWLDPKGWYERFLFLDTILEKMKELEGNNES